jgi:hypothetical protein
MLHAASSRFLLATALVTLTGTAALAQPAATEPAPAAPAAPVAPQNTDWNAVSHINGQVVPVGEKNEYFYDFKRTIISADPLGWVIGLYGVSGSYALDDHFAIRAELDYISPPDDSPDYHSSSTEVDVSVPIYFRRTYQGAFLEPGLVARFNSRTSPTYSSGYDANGNYVPSSSGTTTTTDTQFGPQVLVGWHWTWDSGLNIAVAAGVGRNLNRSTNQGEYSSSDEQYIPNGYLRFGYAF